VTTETAAGTVYHVPSETAPGVVYDVFIDDDGQWVCAPCPDWAAWRKPCKHVFEVLQRFYPALAPPVPETTPFVKNGWYAGARSYPQESFPYTEGLAESTRRDHALETQDERVESLLVDLACVVNERHPWTHDAWRPQLPAGDKVLQSVLRDQHRKSLRRFRPILKRLKAEGKIRFAPSRGTVVKYNRSARTRDYLWESFAGVTDPFRIIDQDVIVDTTGFSPFYISNWRDRRASENAGRPPSDYRERTEWFRVHAIIGRTSKAILAWAMTPNRGAGVGDSSLLGALLSDLKARGFEPRYVIGDNAYVTPETVAAARACGAQLVCPLKGRNFDRAGVPRGAAAEIEAFARRNPVLYDELVRARQAIEGIFSVEKRRDNHVASVGSKTERAAHAALLREAAEISEQATRARRDGRDDVAELLEDQLEALKDEAAASSLYVSRQNEMLTRAIRQVLNQTVQIELRWNRRIAYTKGSVFGPVRETVE